MKIGDKFVITTEEPYNYFLGPNKKDKPKFIEIEIIEERNDSIGEFSGCLGTGFLAKGSDGNFWGYNYPKIQEGYGKVLWVKYLSDEDFLSLSESEKDLFVQDLLAYDVINFQCPPKSKLLELFPILSYCEKHQHLYYKECFKCKNNLKSIKEKQNSINMKINSDKYKWLGWY